jgi:hypothetical protein
VNVREVLSPHCVDAKYIPSHLPQFRGNPLVEALPQPLEPDEALQAFSVMPEYQLEQREWSTADRLQMLKTLSNFLVPLERHVALACELDSLLRNGYVGRAPATPEFVQRLRALYDARQSGTEPPHASRDSPETMQLALLLIGVSGMGKTRFVKRWASRLPKVIYHPELHIYQIPVLHIELPSDGMSVTGLCLSILNGVDKLVPGANYMERFALTGRPTVAKLIPIVERILHIHCVGLLICDEVQNLTNRGKREDTVMTELVTMSNTLNLPLLFIGTNKAEHLFGLDFRKTRRVCGFGGAHWDRLEEAVVLEDGRVISEWREFVEVLWQHQWLRELTPLTEEMLGALYFCSQGVIDTTIKLFAAMQARAMLDGTERLSKELLADVYAQDFKLMHPMLDALRSGDPGRLAMYSDIRPLSLDAVLDSLTVRARSATSTAYTMKPSAPGFIARVATALTATGFGPTEAVDAAQAVAAAGTARNLLEATEQAVGRLKPHPKSKSSGSKKSTATGKDAAEPEYTRPGDLRGVLQQARNAGITAADYMRRTGGVRSVDEVLGID